MSPRRIRAMVLRQLLVYRRSTIRIAEIVFWPLMDLLVWGFVTSYLTQFSMPSAVTFLISATILWDVMYRAQQSVTLSIVQEVWVGNLINLFVSPLKISELVAATCVVGAMRATLTVTLLGLIAYALYAFNMFDMGLALLPFFALLLMFGWAMGIATTGFILRYGEAAEALAWAIPFLVQPISAVFYPISVYPVWLQYVASAFPSTYIFEGMREALNYQTVNSNLLFVSLILNLIYLGAASAFLSWMLAKIRDGGYLTRGGRD